MPVYDDLDKEAGVTDYSALDQEAGATDYAALDQEAAPIKPTNYQEVKKSLARGGLNVASGIARDLATAAVTPKRPVAFSPFASPAIPAPKISKGEEELSATLKKLSDTIHEEGQMDDLQPDPATGRLKKFFTQTLPEMAPYMVGSTAATLAAGPTGGYLVGHAVEGTNHYRQAKAEMLEQGVSEAEAERRASNEGDLVGIAGGAVETLQMSSAVKFAKGSVPVLFKQFSQAVRQKSLKKLAKVAGRITVKKAEIFVQEAIEEATQEASSQGVGYFGHDGSFNLGQIGGAGLTGGTASLFITGAGGLAKAATTPALPAGTAEPAPETAPEVTPVEPTAETTAEEETAPDKPTPDQLHAGHKIPQFIGIKAKQRRRIMKRLVHKDSMADMTQEEAQQVVDEFVEMAEEKGEDVSMLLVKPVFKDVIAGRVTPSEHRSILMGTHFIVKPAIVGKRRQQLEAEELSNQVLQMERVINKMGGETFKTRTAAKLKNKPTASVERFFNLLDTNETAPDSLTADEAKVFDFYRTLNQNLLARENEVRKELGDKEIPNRKAYVRHVAKQTAIAMVEGSRRLPNDLQFLFKDFATKKVQNKMELQRRVAEKLLDIFSRDLTKATTSMIWTATKEIHLNKPLRFFEEMMDLHRKEIPESVRTWTTKYLNEAILGHQTETDEKWDDWAREGGLAKVLNKALKPFGRTVGSRPMTNLMTKIGAGPIYGAMGPLRPKQLLRNKFQIFQTLMLYTPSSLIKSYMISDSTLDGLMEKSLFLKTYGGMEGAPLTAGSVLKKTWLGSFKWTAVTNAKRAMRVAYFDTLDIITNKKFAKYGWADPQRSYTEEKGFLYESEKALLLEEMEFGAGITQYSYIGLAMPEVFRSKMNSPFTRFQSWWMNYWFGFMREGATRAITGKSATGRLIPPSRRLGLLRYLVFGGTVLRHLGYTSSFLFGVSPALAPFAGMMMALFEYAKADEDRYKQAAYRRFLRSLNTFAPGYLSYRDFKKLMSEDGEILDLFFYSGRRFGRDDSSTGPQLSRRAAE